VTDEPDSPLATVRALTAVYGAEGPGLDDPAELFHEASKVSEALLPAQLPGVVALHAHAGLRASASRSVRRNPELRRVRLPPPQLPTVDLDLVFRRRRSARAFDAAPVTTAEIATLLYAAYGVTAEDERGQSYRTAPSGGALYPLEIYAAVSRSDGLDTGLYHYDPPRHELEVVRPAVAPDALVAASAYPEIVGACAVAFVVTAVFWRSRFKYGLRGYRFTLLEAGHVAQNLLLAAEAVGLGAVPLGGYYDRAVDALLRLDGVDESTLYVVCVGRPPREGA
jgi:SagB-type dehydrogenase family enzyme